MTSPESAYSRFRDFESIENPTLKDKIRVWEAAADEDLGYRAATESTETLRVRADDPLLAHVARIAIGDVDFVHEIDSKPKSIHTSSELPPPGAKNDIVISGKNSVSFPEKAKPEGILERRRAYLVSKNSIHHAYENTVLMAEVLGPYKIDPSTGESKLRYEEVPVIDPETKGVAIDKLTGKPITTLKRIDESKISRDVLTEIRRAEKNFRRMKKKLHKH